MNTFRELIVWQKSILFVEHIYVLTKQLPSYERFGLASQMQRAAVSIPSNIAEGSKRYNAKEFAQFCAIAKGSAAELETQLIIVQKIHSLVTVELIEDIHEIQKMLEALGKKLKPTT